MEGHTMTEQATARYDERMALVEHLREQAAWLEAADWWDSLPKDAQLPPRSALNIFIDKRETMAEAAKRLRRADKGEAGSWFFLRVLREDGDTLAPLVDLNITRTEVCDRVVVGTKEVAERVIPAHTEEVVQWHCRSLFADGTPADVAALTGEDK